jgi:UDP-N-acetylglucosamine transferase subunit ALG13
MFPFDRLIRVMDEWTAAQGRSDVFAQIGNGTYEPKHMKWTRKLDQLDFAKTVQDSELIVAHAGMGSVIMADQYSKPIVLLPRIQAQGEHTTDHQIATAAWLRDKPGIHVANTDADLAPSIELAFSNARDTSGKWAAAANPEFLKKIRQYVLDSL